MKLKRLLTQERGGVLVIALAFMVLTVPLTTATLAFVSTLAKHSQTQEELLRAQYGGMGVHEYAVYRLLSAVDDDDESVLTDLLSEPEELPLGGRQYVIDWSFADAPEEDPDAEPIVFQTFKGVDPATAPVDQATSVTYSIEVHNTGTKPRTLERIRDSLPGDFVYVDGSTLFEGEPWSEPTVETFSPPQGAVGRIETLVWDVGVEVGAGDYVTLVFEANTPDDITAGAHCNIAWVDPGGHATGTPPGSAKLLVGEEPPVTICAEEVLDITKEVCVVAGEPCTPRPTVTIPLMNEEKTYEYTIEAENEWDQPIYLCFLFDFLPAGLTWNDIYTSEVGTQNVSEADGGQRVNFRFHPNCNNESRVVLAGQTRTFTLQAEGILGFGEDEDGVHQNAVRMMVSMGKIPADDDDPSIAWGFSGLTADIVVYSVFWITVFDAMAGRTTRTEVWINADGSNTVGPWVFVD